jgi:hypothetical protein
MFTPEFSTHDYSEHILVVNHFIETDEAVELSLAFVRARIQYGLETILQLACPMRSMMSRKFG